MAIKAKPRRAASGQAKKRSPIKTYKAPVRSKASPTHGVKGSRAKNVAQIKAARLANAAKPKAASAGAPDIGKALRNSNPIDKLFDSIGNRIKDVTGQKK